MTRLFSTGYYVGLVALGLTASTASAQFFPGNNPYFRQGNVGGGLSNPQPQAPNGMQPGGPFQPVPQPMVNPPLIPPPLLPGGGNLITNPYSGITSSPIASPFSPFVNPFFGGEGAYLMGAADVINAQGRYLIDRQDALMKREQVKQLKIDTQRKAFDQWLYERENTPRPEQIRQEVMQQQLQRALNSPPANEITTGISLNHILRALENMGRGKQVAVANIPVDEDMLKRINVTRGTGTGNAGLLRNEGKLTWPAPFLGLQPVEKTTDLRQKIDARTREAVRQAASGPVEPEIVKELQILTEQLSGILGRSVNTMTFSDYTEAKKYMKALEESIIAISRPDAREFLTGGNLNNARTVQAVVSTMNERGLLFAPSVANNEGAYIALYKAMVQYHNAMQAELTGK